MKGANAAYMKQKERFLSHNLVIMQDRLQQSIFSDVQFKKGVDQRGIDETHFAETWEFDLVKVPKLFDHRGAKHGKRPDVYEVRLLERFDGSKKRKITDKTTRMGAYYCPWSPQRQWSVDLPTDGAEYFFTATLNGCTVAVEQVGGTTKVTHANFTGGDQKIDQTRIENELDTRHTAARSQVHKDVYTNVAKKNNALDSGNVLDYRATVFGFLKNGTWEFYYQTYKTFQEKDHRKDKTYNNVVLRDRAVRLV